ncbi:hypothetical protein PSAR109036_14530 [Psychrobacter arenosus]
MNENIYCENCKTDEFFISKTQGILSGLFSKKCKLWIVVTSNFSEIEIDDSFYKVFFEFTENLAAKNHFNKWFFSAKFCSNLMH